MSTTIRPRTPCVISRMKSAYDGFGRPKHSAHLKGTKCAVIYLREVIDQTSVRADSSASRGGAEEELFDARLLFHPRDDIKTEDLVTFSFAGEKDIVIRIGRIQRQIDINGNVHHVQAQGDRWASE